MPSVPVELVGGGMVESYRREAAPDGKGLRDGALNSAT
jgi:hypothetical protein